MNLPTNIVEDDGRREQSIGDRVFELEAALELLIISVIDTELGWADKIILANTIRQEVLKRKLKYA